MRLLPVLLLCSCAALQGSVDTPVGSFDIPTTGSQALMTAAGILDSAQLGDAAQAMPLLCAGLGGLAGVARGGAGWLLDMQHVEIEADWSSCHVTLPTVCQLDAVMDWLGTVEVNGDGIAASTFTVPSCS